LDDENLVIIFFISSRPFAHHPILSQSDEAKKICKNQFNQNWLAGPINKLKKSNSASKDPLLTLTFLYSEIIIFFAFFPSTISTLSGGFNSLCCFLLIFRRRKTETFLAKKIGNLNNFDFQIGRKWRGNDPNLRHRNLRGLREELGPRPDPRDRLLSWKPIRMKNPASPPPEGDSDEEGKSIMLNRTTRSVFSHFMSVLIQSFLLLLFVQP